MAQLSDIEIAQNATPEDITVIAERAHIAPEYLEQYGRAKAKIGPALLRDSTRERGKLILVTAINPTPAGEGKTTTTIGLADGLRRIGKDVSVALREPSLGPVFGIKGGAAGGVVGAAAAFAFENRKLIAAVIIGLTVILLLPAVIISMLPSLIFGGTESADLNNPAAVTENIQAATGVINTVFEENLEKISEEIEKDKTEGIKSEIIYPQTPETEYTAALIISQYCAAREKDYKNISLPDFESTVKTADNIYRYEKTEETRTIETAVTVVNAETGEETENIITAEEKVTVYTVFYNGEDYFAESVFNLNEEQRTLADNYLENLMLYLSGGI